ncbi:MAG: Crp/Fnr family transcriptional regulator [Bryobacterales bacterium]|nr:Crp/Fnr family transcriptional regulator [Bryobacteraceae bacterium]MDW8353714.1 Crp/Fnr family transcriptional regulator [Bryobacterales bacterium]
MKIPDVLETLRHLPFVKNFEPDQIEKLAVLAHEGRFERDQIIFREGDASSFFYLIVSGKVALEVTALGRTLRVQTLGDGEALGWSSLLVSEGKHFQARALTAVRALVFDGARLREACEQDPAFGYRLMRAVFEVLAQRLQAMRIQLLDLYSPASARA